MTEPGHLAFGVSPGGALRRSYRGPERDIAPQVRQELGKTHRLHCGEAGIEAAYGNRLRLGQSARFDHLNEPGIAGCVKPLSRRREQDCPEPISRFRFRLSLPSPDGHSGRSHHLKGAYEPLFVSGKQPLCSRRIEPGQPLAKPNAAQRPMKLDRLLPDLRRGSPEPAPIPPRSPASRARCRRPEWVGSPRFIASAISSSASVRHSAADPRSPASRNP